MRDVTRSRRWWIRATAGSLASGPAGVLLPGSLAARRRTPVAAAPAPHRPAQSAVTLPTEETVLQTLRLGHPRLLLLPDDLARVQQFIADDPIARGYWQQLIRSGERVLSPRHHRPKRARVGDRNR